MKAIYINGEIQSYGQIPKTWNNVQNYHKADPSVYYADGWRDIIVPSYNTNTQKLGGLIQDGDDITYQVIDLTDEEIKQRVLSTAQIQKEQFTRVKLEKQIETELQTLTDDAEILENQQGYPLWDDFPDQFPFEANTKVQDFEGPELKLFKIIQPHSKQDDRVPISTPALWSKIEFSGGIEVWSQPIGGDGKYPYLDPETNQPYRVSHNQKTWENNVPAPTLNVWEPGVYGWIEVI